MQLGGRFGYFLFFSGRGRGKGESEVPGRGGRFLIENPRRLRGGGSPGGGGAEGPEGCLRRIRELRRGGGGG